MLHLVLFTLLVFLYILYVHLEGVREAWYYFMKCLANLIEIDYKEHSLFTLQRDTIAIIVYICLALLCSGPVAGLCALIGLYCLFPLIHDTSYYAKRHVLTPSLYTKALLLNQTERSQSIVDNFKVAHKPISTPLTRGLLAIVGGGLIAYTFTTLIPPITNDRVHEKTRTMAVAADSLNHHR